MNPPVSTNPPLIKAMITAINKDDPAALRSALANGADPNGMLLQDIASAVGVPHGRQHFPILFVAARRERLGLCQMLLEFGADPNLRGYHGMRALHSACWRGNCRIVQLLIERGANINLANDTGTVPLFQALANGHRHLVLTMLRAGSRIQVRNRSDETKCNAALNEHLRRMRDSGGWEAHVARHRRACLGVIARCVGDNQLRARRLEELLAEQERLAPFRRDVPNCWELLDKKIKVLKKPPLPEDVICTILSFWSPSGGR